MRRAVMAILLVAYCLADPYAVRAQSSADSLGSSWSLTTPHRSEPAPAGQEGRAALTSTGILMGLGLYGWSLPAMADHPTSQQAFEIYAAGAVASAVLPWAVSARWPVTRGAATMASNGATRGALHGALLFEAAGEDNPAFWYAQERWSGDNFFNISDRDGRTRERRMLGYMVTTSLAEASLGYALARTFRLSEGDAEAITTFGDFGMIAGDAGAQWSETPAQQQYGRYVFDGRLDEFVYVAPAANPGSRRIAFATLAGGVAGQAAGALLASRRHYSAGGASLMRTTGLLGVYAGYCATWRSDNSPAARRRRVLGVLAGGSAGVALGDRLAAGRDVRGVAAIEVEAGTLAGGLAGYFLPYVTGSAPPTRDVLTGTLAGGMTGFVLTYLAQVRHAHASPDDAGSWRLQLEPQGLLAISGLGPAAARGTAAPLVTLRCRLP